MNYLRQPVPDAREVRQMEHDAILADDPMWSRLDATVSELSQYHPHLCRIRWHLIKMRDDLEYDILYDHYNHYHNPGFLAGE